MTYTTLRIVSFRFRGFPLELFGYFLRLFNLKVGPV